MKIVIDDGGRATAGFKGSAGDCAARAITIATGKPYKDVYAALNALGALERTSKHRRVKSSARSGVHSHSLRKYMDSLGWVWTPTMHIGQGCTVHLRDGELPMGRLVVSLSKHVCAVIDGVIHDTHDCSRHGTRCVYGYFSKA